MHRLIDRFVLIQALLRHAAQSGEAGHVAEVLNCADEHAIGWTLDAGLGPLLYTTVTQHLAQINPGLRARLLGADLTARVEHGERVDAALDVIELCRDVEVPVTLLKGISIGEQHYASGHLRPMTDIDILLPEESYAAIEALLIRRGYRHGPEVLGEGSHHGVPLIDPKRGVWIELHTALFPRTSKFRQNDAFGAAHVARESAESAFHKIPVRRLTAELQLAYVASYWTADLSVRRIHPSFLMPVFDAVRLTSGTRGALDWSRLVEVVPNDAARASLLLLLDCLRSNAGVDVPSSVMDRLGSEQAYVGALERRLIGTIIDRYLIAGRAFRWFNSWHLWTNLLDTGHSMIKLTRLPWRILFPPDNPQRYDLQFQLARVLRFAHRIARKDARIERSRS